MGILVGKCSLNITQKELAEMLGIHLTTVQKWVASNELPQSAKKTIALIKENIELKEQVKMFIDALNMLDKARGK